MSFKNMKHILLIAISFLLVQNTFSQQSHWESIVLRGDSWSFLPAICEPPSDWNKPDFKDSLWQVGPGGFGVSDNDDSTSTGIVNSVYLRKKITIADTTILKRLILDIDYDDAFVFYINGIEVARSFNLLENPPLYNSSITTDHEARMYQRLSPERFVLQTSSLKQGENTLAVQILNKNINSSDISGIFFLHAKISGKDSVFQPVPYWFMETVSFEESNIPIFLIDTKSQTIQEDSKINAKMCILDDMDGDNNIYDTTFVFNGTIGIEFRGSSSKDFDKKGYGFETRTDSLTNLNIPLLGLPKENDWTFHGPYSDKSLIRNALAYHLGNLTGRWSPRAKFCELYIDKDYRGVYVLVEKIKCDKHRVDIATLHSYETAGDSLTGGYILKIDRPDPNGWTSPYKARNENQRVSISYVDPPYADLDPVQRNYIKDYVTNFETALRSENFRDTTNGYRSYINMNSFVDYFLLNEFSRNVDAYRLSAYMYKDKDSKGGKLTMGPFWDYDIAFGNSNYYAGGYTYGWVVEGVVNGDEFGIPFWWDRLRQDPDFEAQLKIRWKELRSEKFKTENITNFIDSCATLLTTAQQKNFKRFDILGKYIWPNFYLGGTYSNEIAYLKNFVTNRLTWMDSQLEIIDDLKITKTLSRNLVYVRTYPNPFTESVSLKFNLLSHAKVTVVVQDILGKTIGSRSLDGVEGSNELTLKSQDFSDGTGLFIYKLLVDGVLVNSGKVIRK